MGMKAAMWVHGTIVEAENPNIRPLRTGGGAQFGGTSQELNWFHIPITTPVILDDVRPELGKILVLYNATGCTVKAVHVYDGPTKVWARDGLNLTGDHSLNIETEINSWKIGDPGPTIPILFGLGISVGVEFRIDPGNILFTSAGADFLAP